MRASNGGGGGKAGQAWAYLLSWSFISSLRPFLTSSSSSSSSSSYLLPSSRQPAPGCHTMPYPPCLACYTKVEALKAPLVVVVLPSSISLPLTPSHSLSSLSLVSFAPFGILGAAFACVRSSSPPIASTSPPFFPFPFFPSLSLLPSLS